FEQKADDVGVLQIVAVRVRADTVDDREVNIGEVARYGADGLGHQEADADDQVISTGGVVRQVGNIVGVRVRLRDVPLDAELAFAGQARTDIPGRCRVGQTDAGQMVEALVCERPGIGHQADLDEFWRRRSAGAGAAPARGQNDRQRQSYAQTKQTNGWLPHASS